MAFSVQCIFSTALFAFDVMKWHVVLSSFGSPMKIYDVKTVPLSELICSGTLNVDTQPVKRDAVHVPMAATRGMDVAILWDG